MSLSMARRGLIAAIVGTAALFVPNCVSAKDSSACTTVEKSTRVVARVVDSETIALDDGREVRLVGALGPRAGDVGAAPGTWPAEEEAKAEIARLALGRTVSLGFSGRRTDRHGRLLAHVSIEVDGVPMWLQRELLRRGLARRYALAGNRDCGAELGAAEELARSDGTGLWANPAYRVRDVDATRDGEWRIGGFAVVTGRVRRASERSEAIWVHLGGNAGDRLAVVLKRSDRELVATLGDVKHLQGRRVEVRGWIEERDGMVIDLAAAGDIRLIGEDAIAPDGTQTQRSDGELRTRARQRRAP